MHFFPPGHAGLPLKSLASRIRARRKRYRWKWYRWSLGWKIMSHTDGDVEGRWKNDIKFLIHHQNDTVDGSEIRLTSWYGKYITINKGLWIPCGAGFFASRVSHQPNIVGVETNLPSNLPLKNSRSFVDHSHVLLTYLSVCLGDHCIVFVCLKSRRQGSFSYNFCLDQTIEIYGNFEGTCVVILLMVQKSCTTWDV